MKRRTSSPHAIPQSAATAFRPREANELLKPASGWYSLWLVLQTYRPGLIATAIERSGVFFLDRFERVTPARRGGAVTESIERALDLLASIAAEQADPGPRSSLEDPRWEVEQHPLERFGWPATDLPDLATLVGKSGGKVVVWSQRSAQEFIDEVNRAGTFAKAAEIHGVARQRYARVYKKVVAAAGGLEGKVGAPPVQSWHPGGAAR